MYETYSEIRLSGVENPYVKPASWLKAGPPIARSSVPEPGPLPRCGNDVDHARADAVLRRVAGALDHLHRADAVHEAEGGVLMVERLAEGDAVELVTDLGRRGAANRHLAVTGVNSSHCCS